MRAGHAPIVLFIGARGRSRLIFGNSATTPVTARRVEEVFQRTGRVIELCVGGRSISTTHEHPFYVEGKGWKQACALVPGDLLKSHDGQLIAVESLQDTQRDVPTGNLRGRKEEGFAVVSANPC